MRIRPGIDVPDELLADLCRRYAVARLEVFGSSARGDFRADSDVDLLVEFRPGHRVGLLHLAGLQLELQDLLRVAVDLVPRRGLKQAIRDEVLGDARELYAA
jgi:predicted nucleotidyltransferase